MLTKSQRLALEGSSLQLTVNWFLAECYRTYLTEGSFFGHLLAHKYSYDEIRRFAILFGIYRCRYVKLLGLDVILSDPEREDWKSSAHHLLEELGGGPDTPTHGEL